MQSRGFKLLFANVSHFFYLYRDPSGKTCKLNIFQIGNPTDIHGKKR